MPTDDLETTATASYDIEGASRDTVASFAQERFWFLDELVRGNVAHTLQQSYLIGGPLRVGDLAEAVTEVLRRHDVLRSRYAAGPDAIVMRIRPLHAVDVDHVDLSAASDADEQARQRVLDDAFLPFDLVAGPLFRFRLFTVGLDRHVLVVTAHRSVFDEDSFAIVERDLAAEYARAGSGKAPTPLAPRASFAHFAEAQRRAVHRDGAADVAYWRAALAGAPAAVDLPVDFPRPPVPTYRAREVLFDVPADTAAAVRRAEAARAALALAAFGALLGRYSRAAEVVVGVEFSSRTGTGFADLVGSFTGHLPTRIGSAGTATLGELAQSVERTLRAATAHSGAPFDLIAAEVEHDHDLSRHPVFQVIFRHGPAPDDPELPGLTISRQPAATLWSRVDLELHLGESSNGELHGRLVYAVDLFDESTVQRLAGHYLAVLNAFASEPDTALCDVEILAPDERTHVLESWNPVDHRLLGDQTFPQLFEDQVRTTPDRVAVRFGDTSMTYLELNTRANQLGRHLLRHGVAPEVIVAICLRRSPNLMVAVLAVLKAGGGYLPLDPDNPPSRNEFLLADAGAHLVLTEAALAARLPQSPQRRVVVLEDVAAALAELPTGDLPAQADPDNLIYVIYTSGSTGKPKGVVMTHRPLVNLIRWQLRRATVAGPTLQFSSIGFDISFEEMFSTWLAGGELVLISEDDRRDPERMLEVMRGGRVRRLFCPPMVLEQLAHVACAELPPLAEIVTAGEALHLNPPVRGLLARLGEVVLDNQYGPTEAHVITAHRMTGPSSTWPTHPPVGAPVTNARVYVLDDGRRPVPIGARGEVYVGGVCLAREYLGRPDLTDERFLPDPFAADRGARMYRTGDLGRWQADGTLLFLGRVDEQVKIRGYRVEPGEIEAALAQHPAVAESAVLPVRHDADRRLAAYLVLAPNASVTVAELRDLLRRTLPEYMVPTYFTVVERIPLTPVGKIDRALLPDPVHPAPEAVAERTSAAGTEEVVARIWREVIGLDQVGPDDNFFDIGGHSLLASRAVGRIRHELAIDLSIKALFDHSTVSALAAAIDAGDAADGAPHGSQEPAVITPRADRRYAPLSPIQHGMWLVHQLYADCVAYHMPLGFELVGELDERALDEAFTLLVARHEAFRTGFAVRDGEPVARIADELPVTFDVIDMRGRRADEVDAAVHTHLTATVGTPFDLATPRLWRAVRYVLGDRRQMLLLVMHHIVTDGWSMEVVKRDLSVAYAAVRAGRAPDWSPMPLQFGDLAEWETGPAARARIASEVEFWRVRLGTELELPVLPARVRSEFPGFGCEVVRGRLDRSRAGAVRDIAASANSSPFSVMLSLFALVLARYSGEGELAIGAPLTVRDHPAAEDVVGFFTNTIVLRCETNGGTFLDAVRRTQRRVVEALAHPHVPFEVLVSELGPRRDGFRNPFFEVWFNMLSFRRHELSLEGVQTAELRLPPAGALFDLGVYLRDDGDEVEIELVFRPTVFPTDRVEDLLSHVLDAARQVCAAPDAPVAAVLLPVTRNARSDFELAHPVPIAERVRAVAAAHPGRRAIDAAAAVTYGDLVRQAEGLGRTLEQLGAGPGRVVALAARRAPELVIGILGARVAGATFVVLDVDLPIERLRAELVRLRPSVVVGAPMAQVPVELLDVTRAAGIPVCGVVGPAVDTGDPRGASAAAVVDDAAAYVSHTSGTTGHPLAVVGTEGPLTAFFGWYAAQFRLDREDRFAVLAGLSHDPLLREVLLPLWIGGTVCLPEPAEMATPGATVRWLVDVRCTVVHLTPVRGRLLAAAARSAGMIVPSVRLVGLGGAAVSAADHESMSALFPNARLVSLYGTTETPQGVSVVDLAVEFGRGDQRLEPPLGTGCPAAELVVLCAGPRVAACGEIGEIGVRGPHLALGYLDEPTLTASRFVPDPDGQPGIRLYRTGDSGRYRPDGSVEFLGRQDNQISVEGTRVEPAEIERAARSHPTVADCIALSAGDRLVLGVRPLGRLNRSDLERHLAERLPPPMVPQVLLELDDLPLTANGKLDRPRACSQVTAELTSRTTPVIGPESALAAVTAVWQQVLRTAEIDPDATFFAAGGTSLNMLTVHRILRDRFDDDLDLADLFHFQTPRRLAARLAGETGPDVAPGVRGRRLHSIDRAYTTRTKARYQAMRIGGNSVLLRD